VGDSPIPGAGTWADDATAAISATGEGEAFVVAGFAHLVDWSLREGSSITEAVGRAMSEVTRRGGAGGAIVLTATGELMCAFDTRAMARGWKSSTQTRIAVLKDVSRDPGETTNG
jgi:isoaspartyl peptidase/L-asparaginase-like protein (Ntn-hydrolase superfamily)